MQEVIRLLAAGSVSPVIGSRYGLLDAPEALRDLDARRAIGKLVIEPRPEPRLA